jgi:hypothetical protein
VAVHSFEKRCFLRAESGQGDDAYMSVQEGAVLRLPVLYLPRRPAPRLAIFSCWQSMALVAARHRNLVFPLTLAASALTGVLIWTLMDGQERVRERVIYFSENRENHCCPVDGECVLERVDLAVACGRK